MKNITRRSFLQKATMGAGAAAAFSLSSFEIISSHKSPHERKLNIALCGLGRYAGYLAEGLQETQFCKLAGIITVIYQLHPHQLIVATKCVCTTH